MEGRKLPLKPEASMPEVGVCGSEGARAALVGMDNVNEHEGRSGNQGGGGDGEDPGPDDASGDAPANGGEAMDRANANDGPGDGMRGADGDTCKSGAEECDGAGAFGTESPERLQLGDLLSHG